MRELIITLLLLFAVLLVLIISAVITSDYERHEDQKEREDHDRD